MTLCTPTTAARAQRALAALLLTLAGLTAPAAAASAAGCPLLPEDELRLSAVHGLPCASVPPEAAQRYMDAWASIGLAGGCDRAYRDALLAAVACVDGAEVDAWLLGVVAGAAELRARQDAAAALVRRGGVSLDQVLVHPGVVSGRAAVVVLHALSARTDAEAARWRLKLRVLRGDVADAP